MTSTLGFTGMDRATQAELSEVIGQSIARLGLDLRLVDNGEADTVVVDMDSLYGPMSWMQLHNAGRKVIGYTASARSQTDYHLPRPHDASQVDALLGELGARATSAVPAPASTSLETGTNAASPHGFTNAPAPTDQLPEETATPVADEERIQPIPEVIMDAVVAPAVDVTAAQAPAAIADAPAAATPAAQAPTIDEPHLGNWLQLGRVPVRGRLQHEGCPALYIDTANRVYHGPASLKPVERYFDSTVAHDDFTPLAHAEWLRETRAAGDAQPLSRLVWYAGLLEGRGQLLPHVDAAGRYRLTKWLQTEREFPKHFRIATAMMKAPATVAEIAAAANVGAGDVADFINAGLAIGLVEQEMPATAPIAEPARGLFGIKRGR